ncbi:MAG: NAD(P)/FAD-dependent oxidoreductase [Treponema sp.]|jgi:phytoene dehydrogenase-like protein|nr:NAD(P)/FAD-dependent oxidoreductase [Treponema sp.]
MKKVIVIGAGISGLSAAIYAQRSGFEVTLCEQHSIAGGMCTSWRRKEYLFEGAVHWLTGSSPKTYLHQVWEETGALNERVKVFLDEPFYAVEWDGQIINLYRDIEKTAEHLLAISPSDEKQLRRMVSDVKALSGFQMPVIDIKGVKVRKPKNIKPGVLLKMLPAFPRMVRLNKLSCENYAEQFSHPGLKRLFRIVPDEYSASSLIFTLSTLNSGDGGYPEGGSLAMVDRMADTYRALGGKLLVNTQVKKVNVENGAVTGVTLESGILAADAVIVTQELIAATGQLLDAIPQKEWLADIIKNTKSAVCTFIGLGVRAEIPGTLIPEWKLDEPITCAGMTKTHIGFYKYSANNYFAPDGCSVLTTILMGDTYDFWKKVKEEGRYEEEKRKLANQISRVVCKKYPQAAGNIEIVNIATPLTYERYTGAYHGSWMSVTGVGDKMKTYPGFLKNISGLYFAGHRISPPGGLPVAVYTGRMAAQMVCRQFGVMFM